MFIIDSNQLIIAACSLSHNQFNGTYTVDDVRNIFFNYVLDIKKKSKYKGGDLVFAFDAKSKNWRHAYFPYYKVKRADNRANSPLDWDVVNHCIETISTEIKTLTSFPMIQIVGCEADDTIGVLTLRAVEEGKEVTIVSSDKDFAALQMYKGVKQWSYYLDGWYAVPNPKQFLIELIVRGDNSDSIPNATSPDDILVTKGTRQKAIRTKILEEEWIPSIERGEIPEELKFYERNRKLIDLHCVPVKVKQLVLDEYERECSKDSSVLYTYIGRYTPMLFDRIGEFYQ